LPCTAHAADQVGVYVAPKFVLSAQHVKWSAEGYIEGSESKTKATAGGALAVGYDFSKRFNAPVRAELEYSVHGSLSKSENDYLGIQSDDIDLEGIYDANIKTKTRIQSLMANIYCDIANINGFTPYIGAGLGVAFVKSSAYLNGEKILGWTDTLVEGGGSISKTKTAFAGQIGFGCSYAFADNISADLGYRFMLIGNSDFTDDGTKLKTKDLYAHQFMLGLRVTF
jgi:opacity protein-like surface antigen